MQKIWPIMRAMPLVIAFVALLALGVQLVELWLTREHMLGTGFGYTEPGATERIMLMSAFLRVAIDFVWNLGWAAIVYAAILYAEGLWVRDTG